MGDTIVFWWDSSPPYFKLDMLTGTAFLIRIKGHHLFITVLVSYKSKVFVGIRYANLSFPKLQPTNALCSR